MTGFLDWAGRVAMLVLAGLITLSIIGAIASIPSGSIESRIGFEPREWPRQAQPMEPQPRALPQPRPEPEVLAAPPVPRPGTVRVQAPEEPNEAGPWLEAITYALLAIAGLVALGVILLWRALGHWRRSADALEMLASRTGG